VTVIPESGAVSVLDKRCGKLWTMPNAEGRPDRAPFRNLVRTAGGLTFVTSAGGHDLEVSLRVPASASDLIVETNHHDHSASFKGAYSIDAFLPETADALMAIADYCDGHLYPLSLEPFPKTWMAADRLDMPWFGIANTLTGCGYAAIIETSDDACVDMLRTAIAGRSARVPRIGWLPTKGTFGYARRTTYRFVASGGYVALAKAYRQYAGAHGLLKTLRQKARSNPNVRRLYGAVDVWGDASSTFVREANRAGVRHMIVHGSSSSTEMRAANALGYLTSEYDNYTDILPVEAGREPDSSHDNLPEAAVLNADGQRMKAWLTYDKKTQYMKRCPALWESRARSVISGVLKRLPFLGRFIDVTTAEALYECYDSRHPLTKSDKRRAGERLLATVRDLGLVVGGEHGIWWGVPSLSYIEGMMSSYQFAWPAGHLIRPKDRSERFEGPYGVDTWANYERWGIGHEHRAPLWQLVFHDCVVSTWYWGDSNDFLLKAAPEFTDKKDVFNVLYGTMPMLWANREGSWHTNRDVFLRTAAIASAVHRAVAEAEMVDHAFLSSDRSLQRTRFSDGTVCVVNFGSAPQRTTVARETVVLPQNGFIVRGPRIKMERVLKGTKVVTSALTSDWIYSEDQAGVCTAWSIGSGVLRMRCSGRSSPIRVLRTLTQDSLTRIALYPQSADGHRQPQVPTGMLRPASSLPDGTYEVLYGKALTRPDLRFAPGSKLSPTATHRGMDATARLMITNSGGPVQNAVLAAYADAVKPDRLLATARVALAAGRSATAVVAVPTDRLDGNRTIVFEIRSSQPDLCPADNRIQMPLTVQAKPTTWTRSCEIEVRAGGIDRTGEVVLVPVSRRDIIGSSVRVFALDRSADTECAAQLDRLPEGTVLCFRPTGAFPPAATRRFLVVWNTAGSKGPDLLSLLAQRFSATIGAIRGATYSARMDNGMLRDIAVVRPGGQTRPVITKLMVSSAETGWTDEPGTVLAQRVLADGPVRTIIEVEKRLRADVTYRKRYSFYDTRFEVRFRVRPMVGVPNRAYYASPGNYRDELGNTAAIDGRGDLENVKGSVKPIRWYEVIGQDWAHACASSSDFAGIAYWDSAEWGGIGFTGPAAIEPVLRYRFLPEAPASGFAATECALMNQPPLVLKVKGFDL
jgi:hypothetical protein